MSAFSDETLLILMAKSKGETVKRPISAFLTTYQYVKPILAGTNLKAMRLKPRPQFKSVLDQLFDVRLDGEIKTESEGRELVVTLPGLKTNG